MGWIGSLLLALCGFPELLRTIKNDKCSVGYGMLLMWFFGEIFILAYVVPKGDIPLIFNYGFNLAIVSFMLAYKVTDK